MDVLAVISALTQESRVLKLDFGGADGTEKALLLPHRLRLNWSLSEPYTAWLVCVSQSQALELKTFLGRPAGISIRQSSGNRTVTGLVTAVRHLGVDGGLSACALRIQPGIAILAHRRTSRVFQELSVPEIVAEIVQEHLAANTALASSMRFEQTLRRQYSPRSMCTQYEESDLDFIHRLLAEEGISYTFRFNLDDAGPVHQWVLFDEGMDLPESAVPRFGYRQSVELATTDAILSWQGERQIVTSRTSLASYDYKPAQQQEASDPSVIGQGDGGSAASATLEDYQPLTHYYASNQAELDQYARLRQQAHDLRAKTFYGVGTAAGLEVGRWFTLDHHPVHASDKEEQRQFLVTAQWLDITSNPSAGLAGKLPGDLASLALPGEPEGALATLAVAGSEHHPALVRFSAVRRGIPLVPAWAGVVTRPTARGPLTGVVVGQAGDTVTTDELGRIKVQLRFPRSQEHPRNGAGYDEHSSTYLRVMTPYAGEGFGHQFLPRVNDEVVVDFLYGDIDRPYVSGLLYGGSRPTPQFSGVTGLPGNRTLSGIQTREHNGSNTNELLFDDTPGQPRARLATTHASSELNLGYLTHPRKSGEAVPRGEGAELRTDGAAALRAAQGLLLTTAAQVAADGPHLEREALLQSLSLAQELFKSLSEAAVYGVGASASWELDLFGRVRRSVEAQQAETRGTAADLAGLQILIASEVASSYVSLRNAQERLRIARQNAENQSQILNLVKVRLSAGRGTEQDLLQIRGQLQTTYSKIPALEAEIAMQKHRLAVLVGRPPTALDDELDSHQVIPSIPGEIPPGTPAGLIRRRPDIAAAEARLHAATARVGIATSDLFPKLNLIGGIGTQAFDDSALFHGSSSTSQVLLGIDWSFLDVGRVRARIAASRADAAGLLAQYQQAVLLALEGTENALVRYGRTRIEADHLQRAAHDGEEAERLAKLRYQAGVVDLYQVLDAARTRLGAQDAGSDGQARCAQAAIMLFKELAGGWPEREPAKTSLATAEHGSP